MTIKRTQNTRSLLTFFYSHQIRSEVMDHCAESESVPPRGCHVLDFDARISVHQSPTPKLECLCSASLAHCVSVGGWFSVGTWEMEERPRLELVLSFQLKEGRSCFIIRVNSDRVDHLFLDLFLGKPRESPGEMNQCNSQRESFMENPKDLRLTK